MVDVERPALGQRVRFKATARKHRHGGVMNSNISHTVHWLRDARSTPCEGVYIGSRTVYEGDFRNHDEDGYNVSFTAKGYKTLWLIAYHDRKVPVKCFPEDVEVVE